VSIRTKLNIITTINRTTVKELILTNMVKIISNRISSSSSSSNSSNTMEQHSTTFNNEKERERDTLFSLVNKITSN
jgi:hypothetical protein